MFYVIAICDVVADDLNSPIDFSPCGNNISAAFTLLTTGICRLLKKADFDSLRRAILQQRNSPHGVQLPDNLFHNIISANNLDSLLNILVSFKYWNWVDL